MTFSDQTVTALLGQATGDAWGALLERHPDAPALAAFSFAEQRYLTPADTGAKPTRARLPGLYTDDTQQALALLRARSIRTAPLPSAEFFRDDMRGMFRCQIEGSKAGVHRGTGANFRNAVVSGTPVDTAGVGAAMRVGPVATTFGGDVQGLSEWIIATARVTTSNPLAIASAVWFGWRCQSASEGTSDLAKPDFSDPDLQRAWQQVDAAYVTLRDHGTDALLEYATRTGLSNKKLAEPSNGFALTTVPWAAYHGLAATSFQEALTGVTVPGGDVDTVAAMAGCLTAIRLGRDAIPAWMLSGLEGRWTLENPAYWQPLGTESPLTRKEISHQQKLMRGQC